MIRKFVKFLLATGDFFFYGVPYRIIIQMYFTPIPPLTPPEVNTSHAKFARKEDVLMNLRYTH